MSKIEQLIKEKCPNGVKYTKLKELVDYIQPTKYIVKDTKYSDKYNTPVLTAGQTFILGYTNEEADIYKADKNNPVIIFDDFTTSNHWIDFQFKVKSSAMKILIPKTQDIFKYIYYCIQNIKYIPKEHSRQWIQTFSEFKIPLPPLEVQKEIVKILDKFSELEAELEAELEIRKKQYKFCRDKLYTFTKDVKYISIEQVCNFAVGGDVPQNAFSKVKTSSFSVPIYSNGIENKALYGYTNKAKIDQKCVTVSARGTIGYSAIREEPFYPIVRLICVIPKDNLNVRFLKYYFDTLNFKVPTTGIPQLTVPMLKRYKIPFLSLKEQERIVKILDKFDKLINDISEGIPAEIEARKKQYEYYRNKLLSFEELKTND